MIDVLERYQPLQRVNRLQTGDARLAARGGELLNTRAFTRVQNSLGNGRDSVASCPLTRSALGCSLLSPEMDKSTVRPSVLQFHTCPLPPTHRCTGVQALMS